MTGDSAKQKTSGYTAILEDEGKYTPVYEPWVIYMEVTALLKIYIAPSKLHLKQYSLEDALYFQEKHPFEKAAESALAEECEKLYGKKRVKLTGYGYEQYNEDGWSYYPVQLSVNSKVQGISWIKWQYENKDEYFNLIRTSKEDPLTLPQKFRFCTAEEELRLSNEHRQPILKYDILEGKKIASFTTVKNYNDDTFFFIYELRRQITPMLTNLTGIEDLYKKIVQVDIIDRFAINKDGYTYSDAYITIAPINSWEIYPTYRFVIRWKSNTDKEYIDMKDIIGTDDITFEFSPIIPEGYYSSRIIKPEGEGIISRDDLLEFIKKYDKKNKEPVETGTKFPVYMNSISYPNVILKIRFADNFSDPLLDKMFYAVNDFIQANNAISDDKIHDFNIKRNNESEIWLYIDFGHADPEVIQKFFEYLDELYRNIARIDMG